MEIREIISNLYGKLLESQNLNFELKANLFHDLKNDMESIVSQISKISGGNKCTMDHVKAVVIEYYKYKSNSIVNQFPSFDTNPMFQSSQPSFFSTPSPTFNSGSFFGSQPVNSFFGSNQIGGSVPPSVFFQEESKEQTTIIEEPKETYVEQHWEISDKKETIIETVDVSISTKKCKNNDVSVRNIYVDISSVTNREEAISIASRFVDKTKPFIAQIESFKPSIVEVNPAILRNLIKIYHDRDLFGSEMSTNKSTTNSKIAKSIIATLMEYLDSINSKEAKKLKQHFLDQINPLISTRLVNPNELSDSYKINEISDLYEFYEGTIADEFENFEFYEQLRDIVICTALRDYADIGYICDWNNIIDRVTIMKSNPNIFVGQHSLQQLMMSKRSDGVVESEEENAFEIFQDKVLETHNFTVFKTPVVFTYTNIIPGDMAYKLGSRQKFEPYSYIEPGNILEAIFIDQKKIREYSNLIIHPDNCTMFNCSYSPIVNGSIRVCPGYNS